MRKRFFAFLAATIIAVALSSMVGTGPANAAASCSITADVYPHSNGVQGSTWTTCSERVNYIYTEAYINQNKVGGYFCDDENFCSATGSRSNPPGYQRWCAVGRSWYEPYNWPGQRVITSSEVCRWG